LRILVTGGAGFIGSALSRRLLDRGHEVLIVDDLSTGFRDNVPRKASFLKLDLSDPAAVKALPSGSIDAVCHLAAQSSGQISEENPTRDLAVNAGATLMLIRWCHAQGVRRFLYASSMAIYGDGRVPVGEDAICLPKSHYGVSKLASEHLLRLAARQGLCSTSFRMFSVYGPGQNLSNLKQGMASIYLAYMLRKETIPVTGSLERVRDFIYIDDVVDIWELALSSTETGGRVYNVGRGVPVRVRELIGELGDAMELGRDYPVSELPGSDADQFAMLADIGRAEAELGWKPRVDLKEGLRRMAAWAKAMAPVS
jgi:UDP-glucose 4-epimerase